MLLDASVAVRVKQRSGVCLSSVCLSRAVIIMMINEQCPDTASVRFLPSV